MSKVLFYYSQLNIGGAEKSLIRLMNSLVTRGVDVTLLVRYGAGKGEYLLDKRVRVMALSSDVPAKGRFAILRNVWYVLQRFFHIVSMRFEHVQYDMAFVGLQGLSPSLLLNHLKARKLAVFIRTDVTGKERVVGTLRAHRDRADYYICVAESVKEALIKEIPEIKPKAVTIYNILDVNEMKENIRNAPNPFKNETDETFRILTVCRISDASKALFRMVRVCRRLKDECFRFRWYIVGDGPDLPRLRREIAANGIEDMMVTVGRVNNPFGYYRECDLVAMLSYYEGLCGVVNEAKIAGRAIIATIVSGVKEQLTHGVNGWVVENTEDAIVDGMRYLLSNKDVVQKLTNQIYPEMLLNDERKLDEIYKLIVADVNNN